MFHDLKIWKVEFYWFVDFYRWGFAAALERVPMTPFSLWELAFALGPVQFGVLLAD